MKPATTTWHQAKRAALGVLRDAYLAEVEQVAEQLRPRFESGELRGYVDADADDGDYGGTSPKFKLEDLVRAHFGLEVRELHDIPKKGIITLEGDEPTAHGILAVSSFTVETEDEGWYHVADHAVCAAAWDVVALARRRRWYRPAPDEEALPGLDLPSNAA